MSFTKKNIELLTKLFPDFETNILNKYKNENKVEVFNTPSGDPTILYKGKYIHSKHNPVREANRLIEHEVKTRPECCIFLNFGLAYHIEEFINKFPETPIIIFEKNVSLFLEVLSIRDFSNIFNHPYLIFLLDSKPENLPAILDKFQVRKNLKLINLRSLVDDKDTHTEEILKTYISRKNVNFNTIKRFGKIWIRNLIKNSHHLESGIGVQIFKNKFQNIPAIVLAAGPSIDKLKPYIKTLKQNFIIIAVDTAAKWCMINNLEPDFLIVVDPQYWNTRHLERLQKKSILISESSTHPRIFRLISGPFIFCQSLFPLGKELDKHYKIEGKLGAGGSVSTTAWDFARYIGANQIIMSGLDLGFPKNQTHFKGSFFEENSHILSDRLNTNECFSYKALHNADPFFVENNANEQTLTDRRLIIYKWWFENQMEIHNTETKTLSKYSIKINGIPYMELNKINNYKTHRKKIEDIFNSINLTANNKQRKNIEFNNLKSDFKSIIKNCEKGIDTILTIKNKMNLKDNIQRELKILDEIDASILMSKSKNIAEFLLQQIIEDFSSNDLSNDPKIILKNSNTLYLEILKSAKYHLDLLEKIV